MRVRVEAVLLLGLGMAFSGGAQAALVISQDPSSNVTCIRGTCTATAADAVLNVKDLHKLLKAADTKIVSGSAAMDIEFDAALTWTSNSRLTVDAYRSILFTNGVTSEGMGGATLITNDGGSGGDYSFRDKGRLAFWDLSSSLIINGNAYTLVNDLESLATDVANAPAGFYALTRAIPLTGEKSHAVQTELQGTFEGLGHSISGMTLRARGTYAGLFAQTASTATIRDIDIKDAHMIYGRRTVALGTLVGRNGGTIVNCSAAGRIDGDYKARGGSHGGLVGWNEGTILRSSAAVSVGGGLHSSVGGLVGSNDGTIDQSHATGWAGAAGGDTYGGSAAGGLVGKSNGLIERSFATGGAAAGGYNSEVFGFAGGLAGYASKVDQSFATGPVQTGRDTFAGGLVGRTQSPISNSYATGSVTGYVNDSSAFGGLVGRNIALVSTSYSTGAISVDDGDMFDCGGFFGFDYSNGGASATYWNLDTSGISDPSRGAASPVNDPGVTGLTDAQLKSGLPAGFDPAIWGQSASINNGYPYLLANPPPQ